MRILNTNQIKEVEQYTLQKRRIEPMQLMESAAKNFVERFIPKHSKSVPVKVFCGRGNNGGDGLAIARLLAKSGYDIKVYSLKDKGKTTEEFIRSEARLRQAVTVPYYELNDKSKLPEIDPGDVVIDAILGIGLKGEIDPESLPGKVIRLINKTDAHIVAVDIPSGLPANSPTKGLCIEADFTITFQVPKLAFFMAQNFDKVGNWEVVDIGLDTEFIDNQNTPYEYVSEDIAKAILSNHLRHPFAHKGKYGKALLAVGSRGKVGAALLAARACLRSGAGLTSIHIPGCAYEIVQVGAPEATVNIDKNSDVISNIPEYKDFDVTGIGPGIGTGIETKEAFERILETAELDTKLIIDADAINILALNSELLEMLPPFSLLTPHAKEFERLAGKATDDFDELTKLIRFSENHNVYTVLKGAFTRISTPDGRVYFNSTGNPGMAKGGSGDVLLGLITGLMAQGWSQEEAAVFGVYLHGAAGNLAAKRLSQQGMTAGDINEALPFAWLDLA